MVAGNGQVAVVQGAPHRFQMATYDHRPDPGDERRINDVVEETEETAPFLANPASVVKPLTS